MQQYTYLWNVLLENNCWWLYTNIHIPEQVQFDDGDMVEDIGECKRGREINIFSELEYFSRTKTMPPGRKSQPPVSRPRNHTIKRYSPAKLFQKRCNSCSRCQLEDCGKCETCRRRPKDTSSQEMEICLRKVRHTLTSLRVLPYRPISLAGKHETTIDLTDTVLSLFRCASVFLQQKKHKEQLGWNLDGILFFVKEKANNRWTHMTAFASFLHKDKHSNPSKRFWLILGDAGRIGKAFKTPFIDKLGRCSFGWMILILWWVKGIVTIGQMSTAIPIAFAARSQNVRGIIWTILFINLLSHLTTNFES